VTIQESEPFDGETDVLHLPAAATSVRAAREFVRETITKWGCTPESDVALATSEVVTNAIAHTKQDLALRIHRVDGRARVEVHDADPTPPVTLPDGERRIGGWGMRLVEALARRWGVRQIEGDGKVVWFDIELSRQR
jgi:anti-sigma regulatory factor (Ser/Thr protein kinase)